MDWFLTQPRKYHLFLHTLAHLSFAKVYGDLLYVRIYYCTFLNQIYPPLLFPLALVNGVLYRPFHAPRLARSSAASLMNVAVSPGWLSIGE